MDDMTLRMQEIQGDKELSDTWLHVVKSHYLPRRHLHQNICAHSERLVNKTDVTAMGALDIKMVEEFANEVSARMF